METTRVARAEGRAAAAVRGYPAWQKQLSATGYEEEGPATEVQQTTEALKQQIVATRSAAFRLRLSPPVLLFSLAPPWWLFPLVITAFVAAVPMLPRLTGRSISWTQAGIGGGATLAGLIVLHVFGRITSGGAARKLIEAVGRLRRLQAATTQGTEEGHAEAKEKVRSNLNQRTTALHERWASIKAEADQMRRELERQMGRRLERVMAGNERLREKGFARLDGEYELQVSRRRAEVQDSRRALETSRDEKLHECEQLQRTGWATITEQWEAVTTDAYAAFAESRAAVARDFPAWTHPRLRQWLQIINNR